MNLIDTKDIPVCHACTDYQHILWHFADDPENYPVTCERGTMPRPGVFIPLEEKPNDSR